MTGILEFRIGGTVRRIVISRLVIAGWTGRDRAAVERHVAELAAIGVKPPRAVPSYYRVGASLLTQDAQVEVVGEDSSGEVEFVLVAAADGMYVGVGSDHTDRKVETYDVTVSKQMCPKPIGPELWRLGEVEGHWDRLVLRSHVTRDGARIPYQEGPVSGLLAPAELLGRFADAQGRLAPGTALFCGTLAVRGEIGGGERFEVELHDPVRNRSLKHEYSVYSLGMVD